MSNLEQRIAELSPEKLALFLQRLAAKDRPAVNGREVIPRRGSGDPLVLSFAQQRLWVLEQLDPGNVSYNIASALVLRGDLDLGALRRTFGEILRRHEVLRTTFVAVDGEPRVVIARSLPFSMREVDFCALPPQASRALARELVLAESVRPFDFAVGPLIRGLLLRTERAEHWLLLAMHHMVSDGWSDEVFFKEFAVIYDAAVLGERHPLAELGIQYGDFALWERRWLQGAVLERQLAYWRSQLDGSPPVLELPCDFPRPAVQSSRGRGLGFTLPEALGREVANLGRREGVTLFTLLLSVFEVLLGRYSGQDDFNVGTPVAGRHRAQTEELIGFFVNTLVLRARLDGGLTFRRLLARVRDTVLEALGHQDLPFESLVKELDLERTLSYSPLFQVMFSVDTAQAVPGNVGGLTVAPLDVESRAVQFELDFNLEASERGIRGELEFCTDLFRETTAARLVRHYRTLLEAVVADPDRRLSELPLLTAGERHQLLVEANDSERLWVRAEPVQVQFERRAASCPARVVLGCEGEQWSYGEVNRRANRLAWRLLELGVGPEAVVGLLTRRGAELLVPMLAILKAGGAYQPMDPAHPALRHRQTVEQSRTGLLLVEREWLPRLEEGLAGLEPEARPRVRVIEELLGAGVMEEDPPLRSLPANLAYVIYTSGSTGVPKGVMIDHRGLSNHLWANIEALGMGPADVLAQTASQCFDISVWQYLAPLLVAGRIEVFGEEVVHDPARLLSAVDRQRVTVLEVVPSVIASMVLEPESWSGDRPGLSALRFLLPTGEALTPELCRRWFEQFPRVPLVNAYGPAECSDDVTLSFLHAAPREEEQQVSIGRPVANLGVYLLDRELRLMAPGVAGELCVRGVGVGRGYLNRPGRTAQAFVPDPFGGEPGGRLYRSGDLARSRPDGELEFLRRKDFQLKVRGYRIEAGEVEAALADHPDVRECVVTTWEDAQGRPRLVAYAVPEPGRGPSIGRLRRHLQARLPGYMVPASFVLLEALPRNAHGKLDRRALPAPEGGRPELGSTFVAPAGRAEESLARIWAELLGVERIGVHDNFFALGGDSILSLQMVARARKDGLRLSPRQVFQHQTIAALARVAASEGAEAEQAAIVGEVPLTPIQRWFFDHQGHDLHHYNQAVVLSVERTVAARWIAQALGRLLVHHDALRLRFEHDGAEWRAWNDAPGADLPWAVVDLSGLEAGGQSAAIERTGAGLQASMDLARPPLLRVALFERGARAARTLLIAIHHLVVDTVSWRVLLEDLEAALSALARGTDIELPPKTTSFKTWAEELQRYAASPRTRAEIGFWREVLDQPPQPLPVERRGGPNTVASERTVTVSLDERDTAALVQGAPAAYRTEAMFVLLTGLVRTLADWSGSRRVLVDFESHGRDEVFEGADLSRTVGWFTSVYPVWLDAGPPSDPGPALRSTKERMRAVPSQGIGYGALVHLAAGEEGAEQRPQADILFNYFGRVEGGGAASLLSPGSETGGQAESPRGLRSHALEINCAVSDERLEVDWSFSTNLHHPETIERLAGELLAQVRAVVDYCLSAAESGCTPSDFPLAALDMEGLERLIGAERGVEDIYPLSPMQQGMLFHALFAPESEVFFDQLSCTLSGRLDRAAFLRAWRAVVDRHPILRTAFFTGVGDQPLQVVYREVELPWREEDWSCLPAAEQAERFERFLAADRAQGFALHPAPLMRVALIRVSETAHHLVWSHHHLLLDGWSLPLLLDELFVFYEAFCQGLPIERERPQPFRDFIAWLGRQGWALSEAFWRRTLAGFSQPTLLLGGRPPARMPDAESEYAERDLELPVDATEELEAFARRGQLTVATVLQGAWALLLGRYAGSPDVVFGTTVSVRPAELPGVESMVGLFINTLPVRVQAAEEERLVPWLQQLQELQAERLSHEQTPLAEIQRWSEVPVDLPLFETLLIFENYPAEDSLAAANTGLEISGVRGLSRPNYPLTVLGMPGQRMRLMVKYDPRRFGRALAARVLRHLEVLLAGFCGRPQARLSELGLLSPTESCQLLCAWNDTAITLPAAGSLQRLFELQASAAPEAVALGFEGQALSYGELNRQANRVAHALRAAGVGPEVRVAILFERSPELVVAILAVLKAGGAFVALAPDHPAERLAYILAETGPRVVLTSAALLADLPESDAPPWCLDGDAPAIPPGPEGDPEPWAGADHLAYVVYTSGSTGRPKGVETTQRGLLGYFQFLGRAYGLAAGDRVLQMAPISFDASVRDLVAPLAHGAEVALLRDEDARDPERVWRHLVDQRPTCVLSIVPTMLAAVAEAGAGEAAPDRLRLVLVSGEALRLSVCAAALRTLGAAVRIVNQYGATECTLTSTFHPLAPGEAEDDGVASLGRPIDNTRTLVLDRRRRLQPAGAAGEVYIASPGLARGYRGRPGLTAERFVPDPFAAVPGARLYRTGDLARRREDGILDFLGRVDHQVQVRGFRVEPQEIEATLLRHPAVRSAVVVVRALSPAESGLVAYVVAAGEAAPSTSELHRHCLSSLPDYMVPAAFVSLAELPRTPHGKVDRRALPDPGTSRPSLAQAYVAPRTPTERRLAEIWARVLGVEQVGVEDNFFELGGHSLRITQVVSRVRSSFGIELPLRSLFERPTIAAIASEIEGMSEAGALREAPAIMPVSRAERRVKRALMSP